jgi:D-alanyl-D-alanine carboxypeptidase (penicillin-binding protein 5/6)
VTGRRTSLCALATLGVALAGTPATLAAAQPKAARSDPGVVAAVDAYPGAAAAYVVAVDGRLHWARNPDLPRPPASLAKLLTAVVLLDDRTWDDAARIEVSAAAAAIEGSQLGLRRGEALRAEDALTALLVRSANDACLALVEHFAGSIGNFVDRMNTRAAALGMSRSRFRHPCGLDAPGQQSTARDLLRVAGVALAQPAIASRVALARAEIATLGGRRLAFVNGNALVGRVDGVIGMKSGFTTRAGKCVIAVAQRGEHRVWLVMLGAEERWWTASGMIESAVAPFRPASPALP